MRLVPYTLPEVCLLTLPYLLHIFVSCTLGKDQCSKLLPEGILFSLLAES
jgi:hypothetical protein